MKDLSEIRSSASPRCYLCGKSGKVAHAQVEDRLFGAPGIWSLKECPDNRCGLLWMDPMPLTEDLPKAYAAYYTHGKASKEGQPGTIRALYRKVKGAHLARALGYHYGPKNRLASWLAKLLLFFPGLRTGIEAEVLFLPAQQGGKLLDIGCGSGERMEDLKRLGWTVAGIDFDEKAVALAKEKGLDVACGSIPEVRYVASSFDVIILNHVIEHVPDPLGLLVECGRILKPGGKVVLATPNSQCLGRKVFKANWRGLEQPRHLHIFSPQSMGQMLGKAGFRKVNLQTFDSSYIWQLSLMLRFGLTKCLMRDYRVVVAGLAASILNGIEEIWLRWDPSCGECLFAVAYKEVLKAVDV